MESPSRARSACYDVSMKLSRRRCGVAWSARRIDPRGRAPRRAGAGRRRAPERRAAPLHRDDGRGGARLLRGGPERPPRVRLHPGDAPHAGSALELLRAEGLPDDAGAPEGQVLRARDHRAVDRREHHRGVALRGDAGLSTRHPRGRRDQPHRGRGRARDEHRRRGEAPARPQGHAGPGHDRAPGLRRAARVHGHPRRDPPPRGPVRLHGGAEGRLRPAAGLQRDDRLPARRGRRLRARARGGPARAQAQRGDRLHPGHPGQPRGAAGPGVRGVEPLPEEGPARGLHPGPHAARRVELHHRGGELPGRASPSSS